jgi:hypothetical protein
MKIKQKLHSVREIPEHNREITQKGVRAVASMEKTWRRVRAGVNFFME